MTPAGRILRQVTLFAWAAVCLFPLFWMVIGSFKSPGDVVGGAAYLPFVDFRPTLNAWRYILLGSGDDTLKRFANSALVAGATTLLALLLGGLAGFAVVRWRG